MMYSLTRVLIALVLRISGTSRGSRSLLREIAIQTKRRWRSTYLSSHSGSLYQTQTSLIRPVATMLSSLVAASPCALRGRSCALRSRMRTSPASSWRGSVSSRICLPSVGSMTSPMPASAHQMISHLLGQVFVPMVRLSSTLQIRIRALAGHCLSLTILTSGSRIRRISLQVLSPLSTISSGQCLRRSQLRMLRPM